MTTYEIELACDQHEGEQFAGWLRAQGHTVAIGRTTHGTISSLDQTDATTELNGLWERYCASSLIPIQN